MSGGNVTATVLLVGKLRNRKFTKLAQGPTGSGKGSLFAEAVSLVARPLTHCLSAGVAKATADESSRDFEDCKRVNTS